jgi:Family of unknown function (DUF6114)
MTTEPEPRQDPPGAAPSEPVPGFELQADPAGEPLIAADSPAPPRGRWPHRARLAFRSWRRSRPFWGGLFVVLGGGEILFSEKAPLKVIVHFGLTGLAGYLIPAVMVLCGALLLFNPQQRVFYAILSVLLALASWPTSNLGGFFLGMIFGLLGGSLAFAWTPLEDFPPHKPPKPKAPRGKPPKAAAEG